MSLIKFVRNYTDQSTDSGFQFEFFCDRCGCGYQTPFTPASTNVLHDVLDAAGNIFGGLLSTAASIGENARSSKWEKEHDDAFRKAVADTRTIFKQCAQCSQFVDDACWTERKKRCKGCIENADPAEEVEEDKPKRRGSKAACPQCDASISKGAKFCPECGEAVQSEKTCPECGVSASGKFCQECGQAMGT